MFSIPNHRSKRPREKSTLKADKVFKSGKIVTMNSFQPIAEAVATRGDKIIRVGTDPEIAQLIGEKTEVVDLDGKTMIPGFIDVHVHVLDFGKTLQWLELTEVKSIRELQSILKEHATGSPKDRWIVGRGWDETQFKEKRLPNLSDLDLASSNNPVILFRENSLMCIVNGRALELAGITKSTVIPQDGMIDKDATGELTGILSGAATDLVWTKISEPNEDELLELVTLALDKVTEAGITSVHWVALSAREISIVRKLCARRKLKVRVFLVLPAELVDEAPVFQLDDDSMLCLGGGMIVADGYLAAKTAALFQPYTDEPSKRGRLSLSQKRLVSEIKRVLKANLQLVVQAMGDKAIDASLVAIESASKGASPKNFPHRIEQPAVLNPTLIEELKRQNVVASVQPCVVASEFTVWKAEEHLGTERVRWLYPLKTLVDAGVNVAAGSDCPMEPLNPLLGIQTVVTSDFHPEERISVWEALRMYTTGAAYASKEETLKGSIEAGKFADMTVLSDDPFSVSPIDIAKIAVELTMVGGKTVFTRKNQGQ